MKTVMSVLFLLFALQSSYLLFAGEEVKTESSKENVAEAVAGTSTEAKAEGSTEAAAETKESTEVAVEAEAEGSTEAAAGATAEEGTAVVAEEKAVAGPGGTGTETVVESENEVIATVNGEKVLRKDFERRLNVLRRMDQEVTTSAQKMVVDQLTKKVLLRQFVKEQDIDVSNEEIQEEIEKIKFFLQNNPNNAEKPLEEILKEQGSSLSELEKEIRVTLALSKYLDKVVSDDEKRSYFEANKDAFNGEKVRASHVLIDTRELKTDEELSEAEKKIAGVKQEIDNGADFAEMARKYSDCPSAEKGGDIGFFQRKGSIVEEFAEAAFLMKVGEVSGPIKTQFGFHIIKVTEKDEGQDVSYEDVSDMVDFVYMQIRTEALLSDLFEKAEIEIFL